MTFRVRVLGAGIVGLSVADELTSRGHEVTVVDPAPGHGASYAAAGMLSPAGEVWHGEEDVYRLGRVSADCWPAYAQRLGVHLHATGTLLVGADAGDAKQVDRQLALLEKAGVAAEALTRRELLAREPRLGRVTRGALLPDDHSADPRAVLAALLRRVDVVPEASGTFDVTVVATGASLPEPFTGLVRPVRGEILRVRTADPPERTVRAWVRGEQVYVVPRRLDGDTAEVVIGATSQELPGPPEPTVEGVARLLGSARQVLPGLDRARFVEATAADRPGSPDNLPLIGPSGVEGVLLAAGHFRHGVLLAPLTAQLVADHLDTGYVDPAVDPRRLTCGGEC